MWLSQFSQVIFGNLKNFLVLRSRNPKFLFNFRFPFDFDKIPKPILKTMWKCDAFSEFIKIYMFSLKHSVKLSKFSNAGGSCLLPQPTARVPIFTKPWKQTAWSFCIPPPFAYTLPLQNFACKSLLGCEFKLEERENKMWTVHKWLNENGDK